MSDFLKEVSERMNKEGVQPEEVKDEKVVETPEADTEKKEEVVSDAADEVKTEPKSEANTEITPEMVATFFEKDEKQLFDILSKKTGKEINSFDDLVEVKEKVIEKEPELPESIKKLLDYTTKTGRDIDDYFSANKDWGALPKESVVMEYMQKAEGLDADSAKDYYETLYNLDEDSYTERDIKLAKIEHEKKYREALNYFEKQKSEFMLPSKSKELQREAEEREAAERIDFAQKMSSAIKSYDSVRVGDFDYKVSDTSNLTDRFQSLGGILENYKEGDALNHKKLFDVIYKGENIDAIVRAAIDDAKAKFIEEDAKELSNSKDKEIPDASKSTGSQSEEQIRREIGKLFGNY